ncbi:type II toxin-antitoxin system MqsA family antitoxin [Bradyrhizobium sp. USDA 4503]
MRRLTPQTPIIFCASPRPFAGLEETIRKVRTKLGLSQRRAGAVFRGGPSAFDKYERGLVEPSGPTV